MSRQWRPLAFRGEEKPPCFHCWQIYTQVGDNQSYDHISFARCMKNHEMQTYTYAYTSSTNCMKTMKDVIMNWTTFSTALKRWEAALLWVCWPEKMNNKAGTLSLGILSEFKYCTTEKDINTLERDHSIILPPFTVFVKVNDRIKAFKLQSYPPPMCVYLYLSNKGLLSLLFSPNGLIEVKGLHFSSPHHFHLSVFILQ